MSFVSASSQHEVIIYTDGGCSPNPGRGGWAALLKYGDHQKLISGCYRHSTNNRMEMMAIIEALKALRVQGCVVKIYTDSQYMSNSWNRGWLTAWQQRGWCDRHKKPIKNKDLWQEFVQLSSAHHLTLIWVRGHSGVEGNEIVDSQATQARLTAKPLIDHEYEQLIQ